MAIGWITALKSVPWQEVIALTPTVVDGAKKLGNAVRRRMPGSASTGEAVAETEHPPSVDERLATLAAETEQLRQELVTSSELIQKLANQNAQLVAHLEGARQRLRWLSVTAIGAMLVAVASLLLHWLPLR